MADFPVGEYLKAHEFQVNQESQRNQELPQAVGAGLTNVVNNAFSQRAELQKRRSDLFKEFLTKHVITDADGTPVDIGALAQAHQAFVTGGNIPDGLQMRPLKEPGINLIVGQDGKATPIVNPLTEKPTTTQDKVIMQKPVVTPEDAAHAAGMKAEAVAKAQAANPKVTTRKQDQGQYDQNYAIKIVKQINPSYASSRSVLGIAGTSNMRANRALKLLKPGMTPEDKNMVVTDLQGIMKGGAPDEIQLKQGMYGSYYQTGIQLLEKITANPRALDIPETINTLIDTVKALKEVDNKVIDDNIAVTEASAQNWLNQSPDNRKMWKEAVEKVKNMQNFVPSGAIPPAPTVNPVIPSTATVSDVPGGVSPQAAQGRQAPNPAYAQLIQKLRASGAPDAQISALLKQSAAKKNEAIDPTIYGLPQ